MSTKDLFSIALGIEEPWFVKDITFDSEKRRLDIILDFKRGSRFNCPECGTENCTIHDTKERTWRHLDFFQHQAYLTARVPRITCTQCGVKQISVPWARKNTGFTQLFEIMILNFAQFMAIEPLSVMVKVHMDSLWRILSHYIEKAHSGIDLTHVESVGIDEFSKKSGHQYITVFGDLDESRVVYVSDGRKSDAVHQFADFLEQRGIDTFQIKEVCTDMWPAYLKGLHERFPRTILVFDRYHVMTMINHAVDLVRRDESKGQKSLKHTRYIWLKSNDHLTQRQQQQVESLSRMNLKTFRAYRIKEALRQLWTCQTHGDAEKYLKKWYFWATHSRLNPIIEFAKIVKDHWTGILNFFHSRITNGIIEGINSKIKTAMKRAYGFKTFRYLRTIVYLVAGKLALPTQY
jgi:transposase